MATTFLKHITVGFVEIQSGNGTPDHIAPLGSIYIDANTGINYSNQGGVTWGAISTGGSFTGGTVSGATVFTGGLSANTLNISTTPTNNDTNTQILSRNTSTGNVEYIASSAITSSFNYGLTSAIASGNFLM